MTSTRHIATISQSVNLLEQLQYPTGLFVAAAKNVKTGYDRVWLRDNGYITLGFESLNKYDVVIKAHQALLDILKKHEQGIDEMIAQPHPKDTSR